MLFRSSDGHSQIEKIDIKKANLHEDIMTFRNNAITAKGNFQNKIFTTPSFALSAESISQTSKGFKQTSQNICNLSDGILFENTIPTKITDINLTQDIDKERLKKDLLNTFLLNSSNHIQNTELQLIKKYYQYCKKVKKDIEFQQNISFIDEKKFNSSLIDICTKLTSCLSKQTPDLALIYQEYFKLIYSFIFDFFNTKKLDNKEKHMNEINKILCKQLFKIVNSYEDGLEKFI